MAAKKRSNDEEFDGGEMEESATENTDFYQTEVARYEAMLDRDMAEAFSRYGFTLYHSLPGLKQIEIGQKLGFGPRDAIDFYNLASASIAREQYDVAIKQLQKSLDADGTHADSVYNLALCYEKLNKKTDALNQWQRFLDLTSDDDDKAAVETHLVELKA